MQHTSPAKTYFKAVGILAIFGMILALASLGMVILTYPNIHAILQLIIMIAFNGFIFYYAHKHRALAFFFAFGVNLYGLFLDYDLGVFHDIISLRASLLAYVSFLLMLLTLLFSGLGLFKTYKKTYHKIV